MNGIAFPGRQVVTGIRASAVLFNYLLSLPAVGEKKAWLIPANSCSVLPLTFLKAGRAIEIVDIDPVDLCADVIMLAERIAKNSQRYEGVLLVDTYGYPKDWQGFVNWLTNKFEMKVIHDKCASVPVHASNQPEIDLYLYSTGYAKYLDMGHGGFGYLRSGLPFQPTTIPFSPADLKRIDQICKETLASRKPMEELPPAWLDTSPLPMSEQTYFEQINQNLSVVATHKARLNKFYSEQLPAQIQLPTSYQQWRFNIVVPRKELLLAELFRNKVFASSHYASLAGVFSASQAPYAEKFSGGVVNLFNDFYYTEEQAMLTIELINKHLKQFGMLPETSLISA